MNRYDRREVLKTIGVASVALLLPLPKIAAEVSPGRELEIQVGSVSAHIVRLSVTPVKHNQPVPIPGDGSLARSSWGNPVLKLRGDASAGTASRRGWYATGCTGKGRRWIVPMSGRMRYIAMVMPACSAMHPSYGRGTCTRLGR